MQCPYCHRSIKAAIRKWQRLGECLHSRCGAYWTLSDHRCRWLDGCHASIARLVVAAASADVDYLNRRAQGTVDQRGDPRVSPSRSGIVSTGQTGGRV
jgi:hypothetical protein